MSAQEVPCFYVIVKPWSKMETLFSSFDPLLQNSVSVTILSLMLRIESDPIFCFSASLLRCPASGRTRCNPESYSFGCPESSFSSFLGVERYRLSSWLLLQLSLCVCFFFVFVFLTFFFPLPRYIWSRCKHTHLFLYFSVLSLSFFRMYTLHTLSPLSDALTCALFRIIAQMDAVAVFNLPPTFSPNLVLTVLLLKSSKHITFFFFFHLH